MDSFKVVLKRLLTYPNPFDETILLNGYELESKPIIYYDKELLTVNWSYECLKPNESQKVIQVEYLIESDKYIVKLRNNCIYETKQGSLNELFHIIHIYIRS